MVMPLSGMNCRMEEHGSATSFPLILLNGFYILPQPWLPTLVPVRSLCFLHAGVDGLVPSVCKSCTTNCWRGVLFFCGFFNAILLFATLQLCSNKLYFREGMLFSLTDCPLTITPWDLFPCLHTHNQNHDAFISHQEDICSTQSHPRPSHQLEA